MSDFIKPTDGRLRLCTVKGFPITGFVQCVRVYETLCKPYLTAQLIIIDNDNLIDNLAIKGMDEVFFSFDSPPNTDVYEQTMYVLQMSAHQSPTNIKTQIYEMDLIGFAYFNDKGNLVQRSIGQEAGTAVIGDIWESYLAQKDADISIPVQSDGFIGSETEKSSLDHMKPFAAIDKVRKYLKFDSPSIFYRDRYIANLVPFSYLFSNQGSQQTYIQKETWGINFFDPNIYQAIIVAEADVDKNFNGEGLGGAGGAKDIAKTAQQGISVFNEIFGILSKHQPMQSIGGALGGLASSISSKLGGSPNIMATNPFRFMPGTAPDTKAMNDQQYAAESKNGPQLKIKVPLQTGLFATVGKGITAKLLPSSGDFFGGVNNLSGWWLVKDICHELYTDKRDVKATTTMQCIRKSY